MRKIFLYITIVFLTLFPTVGANAAPPEVSASLQPESIAIGDHFILQIDIKKDQMQMVDFPVFDNAKIGDDIYILDDFPPDTLEVKGREFLLSKRYRLTCFNEGYYELGTFPVLYVDKNVVDTIYSPEHLSLLVTTFDVDTLSNTIFDIKPPENTPLLVDEVRGYVLGGLVILCALAAAAYFIYRAVKKRKETPEEKMKPSEPPHVTAIRELEKVYHQKLWQNNKHKFYYTRISDILRSYLEGRYGIGAMEMTTDEISAAAEGLSLSEKHYDDLRSVLRLADLVKFAKFVPEEDDNDKVYYKAYYFVEDTKEIPEEGEDIEI